MESGRSEPVTPELQQAELTLEQALAQACATKPATKANTGELVHVEQVLKIAGEAAKHAISLRRKRRAEKTQRSAGWAMGNAEAAASLGTGHRTFTDARSAWWDVFAVYPEARNSPHSQLKGTFQQGWLCFDSGTEKRRLSPIPDDWQQLADSELEVLLARADVAASRRKRRGSAPPPEERPGQE